MISIRDCCGVNLDQPCSTKVRWTAQRMVVAEYILAACSMCHWMLLLTSEKTVQKSALCMFVWHILDSNRGKKDEKGILKTINQAPMLYNNIVEQCNSLLNLPFIEFGYYFSAVCVNNVITWWVCGSTLRFFLWFCLLVLGYTVRASCQLQKIKHSNTK